LISRIYLHQVRRVRGTSFAATIAGRRLALLLEQHRLLFKSSLQPAHGPDHPTFLKLLYIALEVAVEAAVQMQIMAVRVAAAAVVP
jgi:hypothetical protein